MLLLCCYIQTHLAEKGGLSRRVGAGAGANAPVDSARANLASTFVNAFVNAGFGVDKLLTDSTVQQGNSWIYKNKVSVDKALIRSH